MIGSQLFPVVQPLSNLGLACEDYSANRLVVDILIPLG